MDNSRYGGPSKELIAYHAKNPYLGVLAKDTKKGWDDPEKLQRMFNRGGAERAKALFKYEKLAEKTIIADHTVPTQDGDTLPMQSFRPVGVATTDPLPTYLYFHGGGFLFGTLESEKYDCASLVPDTGYQILHVQYRHSPEYTHPTPVNDAWDTFEWILSNTAALAVDPANLIVGGASAGACLAAGILYREVTLAREEGRAPRVKGQFLSMPWLVHRENYPYDLFASREVSSMVQCAEAPILPKWKIDIFTDLCGVQDPSDKLMNIGLASESELDGMPKTAFLICGWDAMRDEGMMYAKKLEDMGVPVKKHIFPGLQHAFCFIDDLKSTQRYRKLLVESLQWLMNYDGQSATDEHGVWHEEVPAEFA